jgi:hypothetical protein
MAKTWLAQGDCFGEAFWAVREGRSKLDLPVLRSGIELKIGAIVRRIAQDWFPMLEDQRWSAGDAQALASRLYCSQFKLRITRQSVAITLRLQHNFMRQRDRSSPAAAAVRASNIVKTFEKRHFQWARIGMSTYQCAFGTPSGALR